MCLRVCFVKGQKVLVFPVENSVEFLRHRPIIGRRGDPPFCEQVPLVVVVKIYAQARWQTHQVLSEQLLPVAVPPDVLRVAIFAFEDVPELQDGRQIALRVSFQGNAVGEIPLDQLPCRQ